MDSKIVSNSDSLDIDKFESDVIAELRLILEEESGTSIDGLAAGAAAGAAIGASFGVAGAVPGFLAGTIVGGIVGGAIGFLRKATKRPPVPQEVVKKAEQIVKSNKFLKYLCPALSKASGDVFSIAKTIVPVMATLELSGVTDYSLDPALYATIVLLISRSGIASLCVDYPAGASSE